MSKHRIELKKHAMRQAQDGTWTVTWVIHPNDMPMDLISAPPGTRYYCEIANADEADQEAGVSEVTGPATLFVREASGLCADARFQRWLFDHARYDDRGEMNTTTRMNIARALVRQAVQVISLAELASHPQAQSRYTALVRQYHKETGLTE